MTSRADRLVQWLEGRRAAANASGFVVGLSGGIDSAVVARLCQLARPNETIGVILPCHSDPQDAADARLLAAHFALRTVLVDLAPAYDRLMADVASTLAQAGALRPRPSDDPRARLAMANVKPRLRMATVYYVANSLNYLVVGTGNRSEIAIGYFTKYGDGGVDLLPLAGLVKSEVCELARELGVPAPIIEKPPTAGLWPGQTDEAEMGFSYGDLERYLNAGAQSVSPAIAEAIERLVRSSEHKRRPAEVPGPDGA